MTLPVDSFSAPVISQPTISIVLPVYRNRNTLSQLEDRLREVLKREAICYEILFVNDCCPENSLDPLIELSKRDEHVGVLALSRNVGQNRAVVTGLHYTRGEFVVIMDADLQDPPEAITELLAKIREGYAAVFAGRRGHYESSFRLLTSRIFKHLLHFLTSIPADAGLFVILNRQMVKQVLSFQEAEPYVIANIGSAGLPLTSISVDRSPRCDGQSSYSSFKRMKIALPVIGRTLARKWKQGIWK
jgi:polyisoprenyl-phosphate glycosyltransferase